MGGVAHQEQLAVLHRLDHEAAQGCDAFLQRRPGDQLGGRLGRQAVPEFAPEALVGPVLDLVGQRHLQVVATAGCRALAAEDEAARVLRVDQLLADRRGVRQQAQPAKRVDALEILQDFGGNRLPRHPVETIATGNEVAVDAHQLALLLEGQPGLVAFQVMQLHIGSFIDDGRAAGLARLHQVAGHLGLAIHHHGAAAGQRLEVDALATTIEDHFETFVNQTFAIHARGHPRFAQQIDHALLEHPSTNAAEDVIRRLPLDNQGVDAGIVQQLTQQEPGRPGAHDSDLCLHCYCPG
ncbi:hypothetical protein D3C80_987160 [compost metagenome]